MCRRPDTVRPSARCNPRPDRAFPRRPMRHRRCDGARPVLLTQTASGPVTAGLAITRDDRRQAERLVHDVYVARGLRDADSPRRLATSARAAVFVARVDGSVGATLTLLCDTSR